MFYNEKMHIQTLRKTGLWLLSQAKKTNELLKTIGYKSLIEVLMNNTVISEVLSAIERHVAHNDLMSLP